MILVRCIAFAIACWTGAFLGSYTYGACVRIYHALETVTIPTDYQDPFR
jgi:hypothetical protein